jgi:NodT family efflux transporter outer membrane factor (OMF) lipoprotein
VLAAITVCAMTAGGCATGGLSARSAPQPPPPPRAWSATAQGITTGATSDLATWWARLGDDTLSALVTRALAANTDVRVARERLREARAQRAIAHSQLYPTVNVSGSASGNKRDEADATGTFGGSIDASWEPDVFGGTRAAVRAADADVLAIEQDLRSVQVSLAAEVALTYVELRGLQTRLDIARRNEASQAETLELTEWRRQAGLASSMDVEQARTNVEQTRAQIPTSESAITQSMHRLAVLAGEQPTALIPTLSHATPLPTLPNASVIGIPAETLRQRPDVVAAEHRVTAAVARVASARASLYPSFSLSGSIGAEVLTGVLSGGTTVFSSLAGRVAQTIFDGGRLRQQVVVQAAAQEQTIAAYEGAVLTALEDVENALTAFEKRRQRLDALERAQEAARMAAQLARDQYTAGLADFQRVLDTERTVLSVEESVVTTRTERVTAVIQLYKALGGGWSATAAAAETGKATAS